MAATSPEILFDPSASGRRAVDKGHIAALTGLRGFAALVVVAVHGSSLTGYPWFGFHSYGPIALFVLSGYLLFQPWSRWLLGLAKRPSVKQFALRRLWRIFPPYLVLLGLVTLVYPPSRPTGWDGWLRSITLTNIYDPGGLTRGLYHTWSLGTELSWYAALPIVALFVGAIVHKWGGSPTFVVVAVALAALVLSAVWRWVTAFHIDDIGMRMTFPHLFPAFAVCFFGGALIGHLRVVQVSGRRGRGVMDWSAGHPLLVVAIALVAGFTGASSLGGPWTFAPTTFVETTIRAASMTIMALTLVVGVASAPAGSLLSSAFGCRPMEAIGRWSYGIYLWHMPILLILHRELGVPAGPGGLVLWIGSIAAISIPFGAATYRFVEQPSIARSKKGANPARRVSQQPS